MIRVVLLFASVAAIFSILIGNPPAYATFILFLASNALYFTKEK